MEGLRVESWPLSRIKPYPGNPRNIPQAAIDAVAKSIKTFGFKVPIIVDAKGVIVAGHTRLKAAQKLGLKEAPVTQAGELTPDQARAFRLAENSTHEHASWNLDALPTELGLLKEAEFDLSTLGFDPARLKHLLGLGGSNGQQDPDEIPEAPRKARAKRGQLWLLGEHRLLVGDSTSEQDVERLMGGEKAHLVHQDPPYGVSYTGNQGEHRAIQNDELTRDDLVAFLTGAFKNTASAMAPNAACYIWHASATRNEYAFAMQNAGLIEVQYLIWAKPSIVLGRADFQWQHEPCFYASRDGEKPAFYGDRAQSTVWSIAARQGPDTTASIGQGVVITDGEGAELFITAKAPKKKLRVLRVRPDGTAHLTRGSEASDVWEISRDGGKAIHSTQKPVALAARAITCSSKPGETVLDLFLGSGTTLIACEQQGRRCMGMELDPLHATSILERFEAFTGKKPALAKP